jgi:hypothetical protein
MTVIMVIVIIINDLSGHGLVQIGEMGSQSGRSLVHRGQEIIPRGEVILLPVRGRRTPIRLWSGRGMIVILVWPARGVTTTAGWVRTIITPTATTSVPPRPRRRGRTILDLERQRQAHGRGGLPEISGPHNLELLVGVIAQPLEEVARLDHEIRWEHELPDVPIHQCLEPRDRHLHAGAEHCASAGERADDGRKTVEGLAQVQRQRLDHHARHNRGEVLPCRTHNRRLRKRWNCEDSLN